MFEAPYRKEKPFDAYLEQTVLNIRNHINEKNDDYVTLIVGDTGGGKSTLALHMLEIFMPDERLNINQIALSKEEFASSLKAISNETKPRALIYDEANINKRDALSRWNKELLDLYFSCRGLNICHIWCNPSLQMIDKAFLQDRLRAIILVRGKDVDRPRMFYYFRKQDIMKILKKYENLNLDTITRVRKKYAWFRGWFKDYNGVLKEPYLKKKNERMLVKVSQFFDKYADDKFIKKSEVVKILGCHEDTITNNLDKLILEEDYKITATGRYFFTDKGVDKLKQILNENMNKRTGVVQNAG